MFFNVPISVPLGGVAGFSLIETTRQQQEDIISENTQVKREADYFKENIANITSAEELVDDPRLLRVALEAYGLGDEFSKKAYIQNILESDLSDPASAANRVSDPRWQNFGRAFLNQEASIPGPLEEGFGAKISQRAYSVELSKYTSDTIINQISNDAEEFRQVMQDITNAEELVNNRTAIKFVKEAFGLENSTASNSEIVSYLTAFNEFALNDDGSEVVPDEWKLARETLSFYNETYIPNSNISRDTLPNEIKTIESVILERFKNELADETGHFEYTKSQNDFINTVRYHKDVDSLMSDSTSLNFLKEAFNLENDTADDATVKSYLLETDDSAVPSQWLAVRNALSYHTKDDADEIDLTSLRNIVDKHKLNNISYLDNISKYDRFSAEADNFELTISLVASDIDIASNGRMSRFALTAFGLESYGNDTAKLFKVLNGTETLRNNPTDEKWREFRNTFSFSQSNTTLKTQENGFADDIIEDLIDNTFIEAVGEQDENLRLALYFEKRIAELSVQDNIDSFGWLAVSGEPPLANVFQTAFSLPDSFGQLDVDKQAEIYALRSQRIMGSPNISSYNDTSFTKRFIETYLLRASIATLGGTISNVSQLL